MIHNWSNTTCRVFNMSYARAIIIFYRLLHTLYVQNRLELSSDELHYKFGPAMMSWIELSIALELPLTIILVILCTWTCFTIIEPQNGLPNFPSKYLNIRYNAWIIQKHLSLHWINCVGGCNLKRMILQCSFFCLFVQLKHGFPTSGRKSHDATTTVHSSRVI